ncbi:hypothetical protein BXZ70DRAFT_961154 [Cristinia sonorae]|uniref:Uncharacterized protein n=1 Tax=Cristinia sonorae TaxID=1940300 RepID=A0A8K0UG87_9AGAR|nr:hypothetical protein BXZ70DRAFT_961154 [Cristinia sonorae]
MDVTHAILFPQPPPTSNNLDAHQRARLVRSTRKLGAILGTTPHLLEVDVDAYFPPATLTYRPDTPQSSYETKRARRHASVFSIFPPSADSGYASSISSESGSDSSCGSSSPYSASSSTNTSVTSFTLNNSDAESRSSLDSTDSLPSTKSFSSKPKPNRAVGPRPLVLRLNAIPVAPSDPRLPSSPLPTPTPVKTAFGFIDDVAPAVSLPSQAELRRRKIAKLTRTLGENVPPELVFAHHPARSMSVDERHTQTQTPTPARRPPSQIWVTGTHGWRGEWNRKDIRDVQQGLRNLRVR